MGISCLPAAFTRLMKSQGAACSLEAFVHQVELCGYEPGDVCAVLEVHGVIAATGCFGVDRVELSRWFSAFERTDAERTRTFADYVQVSRAVRPRGVADAEGAAPWPEAHCGGGAWFGARAVISSKIKLVAKIENGRFCLNLSFPGLLGGLTPWTPFLQHSGSEAGRAISAHNSRISCTWPHRTPRFTCLGPCSSGTLEPKMRSNRRTFETERPGTWLAPSARSVVGSRGCMSFTAALVLRSSPHAPERERAAPGPPAGTRVGLEARSHPRVICRHGAGLAICLGR